MKKKQKKQMQMDNFVFRVLIISIFFVSSCKSKINCFISDGETSSLIVTNCKVCHGHHESVFPNAPPFLNLVKSYNEVNLFKQKVINCKTHEMLLEDLSSQEIECIAEFIIRLDSIQR